MVVIEKKSLKVVSGGKPKVKSLVANINGAFYPFYNYLVSDGNAFLGLNATEIEFAYRTGTIEGILVKFIATFGTEDSEGRLTGFKNFDSQAMLGMLKSLGLLK